MARAVIAIVSPQAMLDDQANGYLPDDIEVDMGEDPNTTVISGERDAVFRFLTDDMGVDAEEANEYIDREEAAEDPMGDHTCPECGAGPGEECSCVVDDEGPDANDARYDMRKENPREGVIGFDKYMDQILIKEGHGRPAVAAEDNPQRRRAARHQDRPNNKIRYGVK